ncbi:MAG: ATP-binding protein, partial [Pseudomonadota bacterium]
MRRLYLQIYAGFIAILLIFSVLVASVVWLLQIDSSQSPFQGIGAVVNEFVIPPEQSSEQFEKTIERIAILLRANVTVRNANGEVIKAKGQPISIPRNAKDRVFSMGPGSSVTIRLPDQRWLLIGSHERRFHFGFIAISLLAIAIGIGAFFVARRITRRLERLQSSVEALGAGDLAARVNVEGQDEVANLAQSFNQAADRIERLVGAQRYVLAGVSHEIRTPLARMRVALELMETQERPELKTRMVQDLAELDDLITELLMASRLETIDQLTHVESVDLLALVAEEAARTNAEVNGSPTQINGDPRMLRRLVRNLLENAKRYASGTAVKATVSPKGESGALLLVSDQGPGIPDDERELIFEAFYRSKHLDSQNERGVGLGLSLVRTIARSHGGVVTCKPVETGGTLFEVIL